MPAPEDAQVIKEDHTHCFNTDVNALRKRSDYNVFTWCPGDSLSGRRFDGNMGSRIRQMWVLHFLIV